MKWATTKVQLYSREDEIVVVDDFLYALSLVTHPNDCNDSNFPPQICSASLLSLSRRLYLPLWYSGDMVLELTFLSHSCSLFLYPKQLLCVSPFRFPVSPFLAFSLSPSFSVSLSHFPVSPFSRFLPSSLLLKFHFHFQFSRTCELIIL